MDRHPSARAILYTVTLIATMAAAAQTPRPSKPGPTGSWEELALHQLRLRRMIEPPIQGYSHRRIAREMGIARTTVMRMKPEAARCGVLGNAFESMIQPAS